MAMVGLFARSSLRVPMFVITSCPRLLEEVAVRLEKLLSHWRSCCVEEERCHSVRPYSSWSTQALCPDWLDTSNSIWILQTVTGYKFPVTLHHILSNSLPSSLMTTVYQVVDKVTKLLSHQIICPADPQIPEFYPHATAFGSYKQWWATNSTEPPTTTYCQLSLPPSSLMTLYLRW